MPATTTPTPSSSENTERVLSTLNKDGSRRWLVPRPMKGRFLLWRRIVAWALIAVFTVIPYIEVGGKPLVLLDLPAREFTILGFTFLPTDTLLLALLVVMVFLAIFMVTALLGRVWCGWACPQTVYMEFLYRPLERFFEGTPGRRRRWAWQGTAPAKIAKYAAFFLASCFLAHTFLAYFVGVDRLVEWVQRSPLEHPGPFLVMLAVTALMMFDFSFFREQVCILACPYGRFQSVMLDRQSMIVTYDRARGEPRGKAARTTRAAPADGDGRGGDGVVATLPLAPRSGDCVDCGMCTVCCPTGIDIRDGLQMECIGCAQCIDACDAVMEKLERPRGLIRYSSQAAVAGERPRILRPRLLIYPTVLAGILTAFVLVLSRTGGFDLTVLRGAGLPFTELENGLVANPVKVKIVNRTDVDQLYRIGVVGGEQVSVMAEENPFAVAAGESRTALIMLVAEPESFARGRQDVHVEVVDEAGRERRRPFQLQGPGGSARRSDGEQP